MDIGGTGIKASVLDERGALLGAKVRVSTPVGEPPRTLLRALVGLVRTLPRFDQVSVGFPGAVALAGDFLLLQRQDAPAGDGDVLRPRGVLLDGEEEDRPVVGARGQGGGFRRGPRAG